MDNIAQELAALHDLHTPTRVAWSLAPGWYLVAIMVVLLIAVIGYLFFKYKKRSYSKRQGLYLLRKLQQNQHTMSIPQCSAEISNILRTVALAYYPRVQVASLYGMDWLNFLNNTSLPEVSRFVIFVTKLKFRGSNSNLGKLDFMTVKYELLELPYQLKGKASLDNLFIISRAWIKQRSSHV